jgi:hypothetical protein
MLRMRSPGPPLRPLIIPRARAGGSPGGLLGASSHGSVSSLTSVEAFTAADRDGSESPGSAYGIAPAFGGSPGGGVATRRPGDAAGVGAAAGRAAAPQSGLAPRPVVCGSGGGLGGLSPAAWAAEAERLVASGCGLAALSLAGPTGGTAKCYVRRAKGLLGGGATYEMRIESSDRLLASARRRGKNKCSSYLLALCDAASGEVSPLADEAVAKVRGALSPQHLARGGAGCLSSGFS